MYKIGEKIKIGEKDTEIQKVIRRGDYLIINDDIFVWPSEMPDGVSRETTMEERLSEMEKNTRELSSKISDIFDKIEKFMKIGAI